MRATAVSPLSPALSPLRGARETGSRFPLPSEGEGKGEGRRTRFHGRKLAGASPLWHDPPSMPLDLAALAPEIQRFASHLASERRGSDHTSKAYLTDLAQYAAHLAGKGVALVPSSPGAVRSFLASASAGCGAASIARKLSTLRNFYRF